MMTRLLSSEELEVLLQEEVASEEESPFDEVLTLEEVPAFEETLPAEELASGAKNARTRALVEALLEMEEARP